MNALPTGTLTFLFTDIEGSTKLWEQFPEEMQQAHARHGVLVIACIEEHGGTFVRTRGEGDSTFSVFPNALDALAAACAFQRALAVEPWPQHTPIRVRAALHTGTAHLWENDYNSSDVNRCARLRAIAHGGQTVLSQTVYELVAERLPEGITLKDMGLHRLKDLSRPEHVYQLLHPDLPANFPPLASLNPVVTNLPQQQTSFIGREAEMEHVRQLLETTRLLTLTGAGGSGKTRLALQVAAELVGAYLDGVWLVEFAALTEESLVAQTVASVLGLREEPGRNLTRTLSDYLQPKTLLLILDNCEHLVDDCARLADTLLRSCPQIKILATSREALKIGGEQTYRIPSLLLPNPQSLPMEEKDLATVLMEYDAIRLFVERAHSHVSSFALNRRNGPVVAEVCSRLDGIPLAIELAAARIRALTVEQIAARLNDRFRLLTGGSRIALPRQQTLKALIDWSYDLLNTEERLLLQRLSVFSGGWTLEAAEQVGAGESIEPWQVLDLLTGLVDKSLVVFDEQEGGTSRRYRLLDTIREYGWHKLQQETTEEAQLRDVHLLFFLEMAEAAAANLTGAGQAEWLERLESEHDNLRAAINWCRQDHEKVEAGLRLTGALARFWERHGYFREGRAHLQSTLDLEAGQRATSVRARALSGAGSLAWRQGDYAGARAFHEQSLAIWRELGDKQGIAISLNNLANVAWAQGDFVAARALNEESLTLRKELDDKPGIAISLNNLGNVASFQSDYVAARALYEESLAIKRALGDRWGVALTLNNLGNVAYDQGDFAAARTLHAESLAIKRELGDRQGVATSLNGLGNLAYEQGDYAAARLLYEESLTLFSELGDKTCIAYSLEALAALAGGLEQPIRAARLWSAAQTLRDVIGSPLRPSEREEYDIKIAGIRMALGEMAFSAAWEEGRAMSFERAIEYALEDR